MGQFSAEMASLDTMHAGVQTNSHVHKFSLI